MAVDEPRLFARFPGLRGKVPWMPLGRFPTPVERLVKLGEHLGRDDLYVKRDDLSGEPYGGNKVRKLEFTLADARARGCRTVITAGAVGSNHVVATSIYGREANLRVVGILVPQPVQENLRSNVLACAHVGAQLVPVRSDSLALAGAVRVYARWWRRDRRRPYVLWVGGSSTVGVLGYVEAALEIAEQVEQGALPRPATIFVPVGSSGTLAGLVLGLALAELDCTAIGVRVYDKTFASERVVAHLARRALRYLRRRDSSVPRLDLSRRNVAMIHDYFGLGYARYTRRCVEAMELARRLESMKLEGTYSGKAQASFIDAVRSNPAENLHEATIEEGPALFINTYNSRSLDPLGDCAGPQILPKPLRAYFEREISPVDDR